MTPRRAITTHADILLSGLVGALFLVEIFSEGRFAGDRGLSVPVALLFSATLAARRSAPLLGLLAGVGVIVLSNNLGPALADTPRSCSASPSRCTRRAATPAAAPRVPVGWPSSPRCRWR